MSGKQQRAAALARWAVLTPEQRRAATASATEAANAKRRAKTEREAAALAQHHRTVLAAMRPETLAAARRVLGPDASDDAMVQQCLLIAKARKALADSLDPQAQARERAMRDAIYRSSKDQGERDSRARRLNERNGNDHRRNEEGLGRANDRAQEANGHRPAQGTS